MFSYYLLPNLGDSDKRRRFSGSEFWLGRKRLALILHVDGRCVCVLWVRIKLRLRIYSSSRLYRSGFGEKLPHDEILSCLVRDGQSPWATSGQAVRECKQLTLSTYFARTNLVKMD